MTDQTTSKAGQKWTSEEDQELMTHLEEHVLKPDELAKHLNRTVGSVQNRALNVIYNMVNGQSGSELDELCNKYHINMSDMNKYLKRREDRTTARREARRQQRQESTTQPINSDELVSILKDIRNYMKIIIDKLEK